MIKRIVLTGGPCSGKTTCLSKIEEELTNKGYKVIIVPEIATELMKAGLNLSEVGLLKFQESILSFQIMKDLLYNAMALTYENLGLDVIIINDRGAMDSKAYMPIKDWNGLIEAGDLTENSLMNAYDAVFHLKTAAYLNGVYTIENNETRSETKEEAITLDSKTMNAWNGHSHLRVIDNCEDFSIKITNLMNGIYLLLGIPVPVEIEKKFLIYKPDIDFLKTQYKANMSSIIQTYLKSDNSNVERRVRQRGINGNYTYFYTEKENVSGNGISRYERERKIDKNEYLDLLMQADTSMVSIRKDRYCFVDKDIYYELDIYPEWDDRAVFEVELTKESQIVEIPFGISLIKEVTEDEKYKNYNLAKNRFKNLE